MKLSRFSLMACAALIALPAFAQVDGSAGGNTGTYTETRLSSLEEQMRALNGRVEQVEFTLRRIDAALQRIQSDDDARLTKLEQTQATLSAQAAAQAAAQPVAQPASAPSPQPPQATPNNPPEASGTLGAIKVQDGKVVGGVNAPKATPLPAVPADYGLTTDEQYEHAFGLLRAANYPDAEAAFKNFIDKNPKDKLIDNAKYWYGETLYVRGKFEEAAVAFADAYQQNTKGTKAPDSLLKLGMSLAALNKNPDACVTLNELKTKYPGAPSTIKSRAADERARLKCPAH